MRQMRENEIRSAHQFRGRETDMRKGLHSPYIERILPLQILSDKDLDETLHRAHCYFFILQHRIGFAAKGRILEINNSMSSMCQNSFTWEFSYQFFLKTHPSHN